MNESDIRLAVSHALQWHGWWTPPIQDGRMYFCKEGHPVLVKADRKGYPDIRAEHPVYPLAHIEVKAIGKDAKSFAFAQIEPEQRNYLTKWSDKGGAAYLAIGKIVPSGSKSKIGGIWVFPWHHWLNVESRYQKSIAYSWGLYEKRPLDWEKRGSIIELQDFCELEKTEEGWQFHPAHWLAFPPKVEIPYYKQEKVRADEVSKREQIPVSD